MKNMYDVLILSFLLMSMSFHILNIESNLTGIPAFRRGTNKRDHAGFVFRRYSVEFDGDGIGHNLNTRMVRFHALTRL
ncbi:hypothetical protein DPMN_127101 [Dreissena polymorpha]|uniref:Uncharacterized protein n=1 Tax=Dreissena polymorpha TaxID=45954 RepID=A0A9D4H4L8_DREPO|nr:hypothetical protein DPMN_127101 [Dreissena polymorpha]